MKKWMRSLRRALCAALAVLMLALPALAASQEADEGTLQTSYDEIDVLLPVEGEGMDDALSVIGEVSDAVDEEAPVVEEQLGAPEGADSLDQTEEPAPVQEPVIPPAEEDPPQDPEPAVSPEEPLEVQDPESPTPPEQPGEVQDPESPTSPEEPLEVQDPESSTPPEQPGEVQDPESATPLEEPGEAQEPESTTTPEQPGEVQDPEVSPPVDAAGDAGVAPQPVAGAGDPEKESAETPAESTAEGPAAGTSENPSGEDPAGEREEDPEGKTAEEGSGEDEAEESAEGDSEESTDAEAAESNDAPVPPAIAAPRALAMGVKESRFLGATLTGDAEGLRLIYSTSNPRVVLVGADGRLTARKRGKATIYMRAGNLTASCAVSVVKAPRSIRLNAGACYLGFDAASGTGTQARLYATTSKGSASAIYWSGYNKNILHVAANGTLTALGVGRTTVYARTFNNKVASCVVTVLPPLETLTLNAPQFEVGVGCLFQLAAANAAGRFPGLRFSSDNPGCAVVDGAGRVRGVSAGQAVITVTSFNGLTAQSTVTVLPGPTAIRLRGSTIYMGVKEKLWLNATPVRSDGQRTATAFAYATSKKRVVTVTGNGLLTAKKRGTAWITVVASNGVRAVCMVKVVKAPKKVVINQGNLTLCCDPIQGIGTSARLTTTVTKGTASSITWTGYNRAIVSVAADGTVTARGVGSTWVTARTFNGKTASRLVTVRRMPEEGQLRVEGALSLWRGQGAQLHPSFSGGTWSPLRYGVDDASVLSVDGNGRIISKSVGTATVTAFALNGVSTSCAVTVAPYRDSHPLLAIAHRGGGGYWPENTLEAFSKASSKGADGVELDARTTKDGIQVVHHDPNITVGGKSYAISKYKYAQLKQLKPSLCTLDEALRVIASTNLIVQLELKDTAKAATCVAAVNRAGLRGRTTYISFYTNQLAAVRKADSGAKLGFISSNVPSNWASLKASLRLSAISVNGGSLPSQGLIDEWHRNGLLVCVWTINDEATARRIAAMDVDMICGDYPDRLKVA